MTTHDDDAAKGGAQERGYRVLMLLAGHEFEGMAPGEIAKALDTSPANISRDLRVLQRVGLAEYLETIGRWRLGPKVVQIALAFQLAVNAQRTRLDEVTNRYSRTPN